MSVEKTLDNYPDFVKQKVKDPQAILESLDAKKCALNHAAMGIAGEAGELLDAIKKHIMYDKPLDIENVIEELGDLEFYMQDMRTILGVSRDEILEDNIKKLNRRYKSGYTDTEASERNDKK